ncbi:autotransporter assembly complex protein TamA [Undibacterium luofuense]|uniref:BamA/TamA family outer membrane protein n=1 Tax=Undibacterium luofuense TaxID=2828733 RepID=A0A941DNL9_9BURK|nr:BamA/TamA family outer membrane protein [Undibacterium luofuense]MBR7781306.1 BamA/TamA family outer membrane protein [Undibacterium luofuense]
MTVLTIKRYQYRGIVPALCLVVSASCFAQETGSLPTPDTAVLMSAAGELSAERLGTVRFVLSMKADAESALLKEHIPEFGSNAEPQNVTPALLRRLRQDISGILATEGYFNPQIRFEALPQGRANAGERQISVMVERGDRSMIENVSMRFSGAFDEAVRSGQQDAVQRQRQVREDWGLAVGQPFRESDWSEAKNVLLESFRSDRYAAAKLQDTAVKVDAGSSTARVEVTVDSGPEFKLGALNVKGLQRYPLWLLDRYDPPKPGELYSRNRLLDFQRTLQNSPYFAAVAVQIDADPDKADAVPVEVNLTERKARDLSFGAGYSSNTGFRGEIAYRDRDILNRAWDLRSAVRIEQKRQLGYADVYLPPSDQVLNSFGVLADRQDVSGVLTVKQAIGVRRTSHTGNIERRFGLNLLREKSTIEGEPTEISKALVWSAGWTWRDIDDAFNPHQGKIIQADIAVSEKALLSDQRFVRLVGKYQQWVPVNKQDTLIFRVEAGQVVAPDEEGIPEEYLFRTGGASTVRGYAYQSIGIPVQGAVTGGRVMAVASAEALHWLNGSWGIAAFADVGDATSVWRKLSLKKSVGTGLRYRTPAGPVALDLGYALKTKRARIDFSIAIAF